MLNFWATASAIFSIVSPLRRSVLTISLKQVGKGIGQASRLTRVPENVPADRGKILLQLAGMFSGGGMTRRAWEVPADAGAMPRTACNLVIGKGFGDLRQRG